MARKKKRYPLYKEVEIIDLAVEGKAVGKVKNSNDQENDLTIFVEKVIPGDVVDVQINKKRKNYKEGYPVKFHKFSDKRIEPFCKHFGICGGCTRQNIDYKDQLFYKQKHVNESLKRISKVKLPEIKEILAAPDIKFYRNKLEYTFSNSRWLTKEEIDDDKEISDFKGLGFHIPGRFDKVLDIEKCWLQATPSNEIRLFIKDFALKNGYDFFNLYKNEGFLRNLIIRTSSVGEILIILSFYEDDISKINTLLEAVSKEFPQITSVNYVINNKVNDSITDLNIKNFSGKDHMIEKMEEIRFKVGPKSFYQTNSIQAYNLYKIVEDFAQFKPEELVYDLYTGTGTIANFIAGKVKEVIGIEYIEEAIKDAEFNSEMNKIANTQFFAGDMKDILNQEFINIKGKPDTIISDPPRAGMHKDVVKTILNAEPEKIVYVSCNVATQARDIELLDIKYKVTRVQPVDMFPHTHHIENVILLEKR